MSKLSPARKLALDVLMEADRRGMYARDVLSSRASAKAIDQRDSAFAARLALGVAATQGILDELLDQFLDKPKKVAPRVRMALRISAFEMLYLHTPGRVAVSQGVELVRSGAKSAAGLANAVLHKVADNVENFAAAADADESERRLVRLSRLMGLPRWLCARIMASFDTPEGALSFAGNLAPAPLALHENAFATKPDPYLSQLVAPVFPGCHAPVDAQATVASGVFERAAAVASDLNAQLIATAATRPGRCLEIGAGRGTKTYVMMCQAKRAGMSVSTPRSTCMIVNAIKISRACIRLVSKVFAPSRAMPANSMRCSRPSMPCLVSPPCSIRCLSMRHARAPEPCAAIPRFPGVLPKAT